MTKERLQSIKNKIDDEIALAGHPYSVVELELLDEIESLQEKLKVAIEECALTAEWVDMDCARRNEHSGNCNCRPDIADKIRMICEVKK